LHRYWQYNRAEVLGYFQVRQTDILVVGDWLMRQLFVRLVHLFRGARRVLDYNIDTHASYWVCDEASQLPGQYLLPAVSTAPLQLF
jgi:hypothetical protein